MSFTILSTALARQLSAISGVVPKKPIVPILDNFLFKVEHDTLTVSASDLQTSISATLTIDPVDRPVCIALPARILLDTLKNLPEQLLTFSIEQDSYSVAIQSDNGRYKLVGEDAADFPQVAEVTPGAALHFDTDILKKALRQTTFATSHNELKPAMNGVYMHFHPTGSTYVATDGFRLARYIRKDVQLATHSNAFIVPHNALTLLTTLLPSKNQTVTLTFHDTHIYFQLEGISMVSKLIDERYPDYENVIPTNHPNKLTVHRLSFVNSLKRMAIYANKTTHQVKLSLTTHTLQLCAEDFEFSNEATEQLGCEYEGENIEIGFNARLLIEVLTNILAEEIEIYLGGPHKAALLLPKEKEEQEEILLLMMPIH